MFRKAIFPILLNLLICSFSIVLSSGCIASDYQISPAPQWVETGNVPTEQKDSGIENLLVDVQTKVDPASITYVERRIKKVLKSESIQDVANIEINFYPQHETIRLHHVSLHRGAKTFNQIAPKNIRVLQREKQLENQVYTGEKSLFIFLEDIRVGDVLDYRYSVENRDPRRLKDFYLGLFVTQSSPVAQVSYRLLWPKDRPLTINNHNTNIVPKVKNVEDEKEYVWEMRNVEPERREENTPYWYKPWGWIEISTTRNWNAVAITQSKNYEVPKKTSKELKQFISSIQKEHRNPDDQLIKAIRFIQDEIRYMSISDETDLPSDPSIVFQRRYGDCRDKSLLALTILKGLGVKASAALVDTDDGKILDTLSPRYSAFNHVIICVQANGKQYWFDPTATFERGNLENLTQPNFGYALVLDPSTTSLVEFPQSLPVDSSHMVFETIDLTKGFEAPALFNIKTVYKGKYANLNREWLVTQDKEKLKSRYFDYYKEIYPSVIKEEGFEITDDLAKNEITIVEAYKIQNPGVANEGDKSLNFWHNVNELQSYYKEHPSQPRKDPLAVTHPILFIKNIELLLPEQEWDIKPEKIMVNDTAFYFMKSEQFQNHKYSIFYQYVSHADHVKAEKATEHVENINTMKEALGGGLTNPPSHDSINWPVLMLSILVSIIFGMACYKSYFYKPRSRIDKPIDSNDQGLRGWLILVGFGLIVSPIVEIKDFIESFPIFHSMNAWDILSNPMDADFHPMKGPFILSLLFFIIAEEIFSILLLFLFFKKKQTFPIMFIVFTWVCFVFTIGYEWAGYVLLNEPSAELYTIVFMLIGSVIWTAYFVKSKRVKATFIRD